MFWVCCLAFGGGIPMILVGVYLNLAEDLWPHVFVALGHLVVAATLLSLRFSRNMTMPATLVNLGTIGQLVNSAYWSGGAQSSALYVYPIATVFIGLLCGIRQCVFTAVVLTCASTGFFVLQIGGYAVGEPSEQVVNILALAFCMLVGLAMALYNQHQSDALLARANQEVERRRVAQEEAEEANEAKDMFMAFVSHEIRTPLSIIISSIDLTQLVEVTERDRHHVAIQSASTSLTKLLDDVLDFVSVERGGLRIEPLSFDAAELAEAVVQQFASDAESKTLELSFACATTDAWVWGDSERLNQVLVNLVSNAIKFTEQGGVNVLVERADETMRISVSDSGMGIPLALRASVFQPFTRSHPGSAPGHGLGLAISRGLVELMGGTLTLDGSDTGGCTFTVLLPVSSGVESAPDAPGLEAKYALS